MSSRAEIPQQHASSHFEGSIKLSRSSGEPVRKGDIILEVNDLSVRFWVGEDWFTAAENMTYELRAGEVLAIVGESGSGKTQSSMSLMGLLPRNGRATGSAKLKGTELVGLGASDLRHVRGNEISMIFQEPMTALNPVYTVGFQIVETLRTHFLMAPAAAKQRALELMTLVEIPEPEDSFSKFPHQLSGGQRQRIMIAQALACDPKLLIADEPTTALDVTVQAEILKLMRELRERVSAGIILITHDMGVVADMADRIIVMKDGRVVEQGTSAEIFHTPQHPYTQQLLAAVPHLGRGETVEGHPATLVARDDAPIPVRDGDASVTPALLLEDVENTSTCASTPARSSGWWASPARARPPSDAPPSPCCPSAPGSCRSPVATSATPAVRSCGRSARRSASSSRIRAPR